MLYKNEAVGRNGYFFTVLYQNSGGLEDNKKIISRTIRSAYFKIPFVSYVLTDCVYIYHIITSKYEWLV
ncbi:MAG: hypothetical protein ACLSHR_00075 [Oscillospiraceae bacterium]